MLLIAIFVAFVAVRYAAVLFLAALIIRPVQTCPACRVSGTLPIRQPWLWPIARHYEWRWCPGCGWQAIARRVTADRPVGLTLPQQRPAQIRRKP